MTIRLEYLIPLPLLEQQLGKSEFWENSRFDFEPGTSYLVEAPSGRGKTSLLSIIYGLRKDYRGKVFIDDKNISLLSEKEWSVMRKNRLSFIFQGLELFDELTAIDNIRLKNSITRQKTEGCTRVVKQGARINYLKALKNEARTMVFYISCHRISDTLSDIKEIFGDERLATFAREITKTYETIRRATLAELCDWVREDGQQHKGEIVLVVAGSVQESVDDSKINDLISILVDELPVKQAAKIASRITGQNKNDCYKAALLLKEKHD